MNDLKKFAYDWIDSWNAHDLDRILSHYSDEIEFTSPFVVQILKDPTGTIYGKSQLQDYFKQALDRYPDLKFTLFEVLEGTQSLIVYYQSVNQLLAAEMMLFNEAGKIARVWAHYKKPAL